MKIVLGSTSEIKYHGVSLALLDLQLTADVVRIKVPSGVSSIPQGMEETFLGASNRANNSLSHKGADYYLGIESGLISLTPDLPPIDIAICVLRNRAKLISIGTSSGLMYPVAELLEAKLQALATGSNPLLVKGSIITKGDPSDPHQEISKGRSHRSLFIKQSVWSALLHLVEVTDHRA